MALSAQDYAWFDAHQARGEDAPDRRLPDGSFNGDASSGRSFAAVCLTEVNEDTFGEAPARAFALAEYVTGVRFTAETLSDAVFRCVSQPELGSR